MSETYVIMAVVQSVKAHCEFGHQVGDQIVFNSKGVHGRLCLWALSSLLISVLAMRYGANFPWLEDKDVAVCACPDIVNCVIFQLRRTVGKGITDEGTYV